LFFRTTSTQRTAKGMNWNGRGVGVYLKRCLDSNQDPSLTRFSVGHRIPAAKLRSRRFRSAQIPLSHSRFSNSYVQVKMTPIS
jgi:hypothetical protein